jgi:hypothetical protein
VSKSTFLEVAYRRLLLFTELPRRGVFSGTKKASAPFLKDDKQRNAADAFGASAVGPTPTISLYS